MVDGGGSRFQTQAPSSSTSLSASGQLTSTHPFHLPIAIRAKVISLSDLRRGRQGQLGRKGREGMGHGTLQVCPLCRKILCT